MGERDDALRTIADARTRLSVIADELGRRAAPEHLKEVARELATGKADELKHRARDMARDKVHEMKRNAKEVAMRRTHELRYEATETPRGMGLLGALLGAGLGSVIARKIFEARHRDVEYRGGWREDERDWGYERSAAYSSEDRRYHDTRPRHETQRVPTGYEGEVGWREREPGTTWAQSHEPERPGMGERAGEKVHEARERAGETVQNVKERAGETVQNVKERASGMMGSARERAHDWRERLPSRDEMRGRGQEWYGRAVEEQPMALALGAIAFGALAAALLPVSGRERRMLEPARRKAEEAVSQMGGALEERLSGSGGQERPEQDQDWEAQQQGGERPWSSEQATSSSRDYNTYGTEETQAQSSGTWSGGNLEGTPSRAWNDRREVHSPDVSGARQPQTGATSGSGSVAESVMNTAGATPSQASGANTPPAVLSPEDLAKTH